MAKNQGRLKLVEVPFRTFRWEALFRKFWVATAFQYARHRVEYKLISSKKLGRKKDEKNT